MIWLFMAVWLNGREPSEYKLVAKIGPFEKTDQCWATGALLANETQSKDDVSNAIGACVTNDKPTFVDFKSMWSMVCLAENQPETCWFVDGKFKKPN